MVLNVLVRPDAAQVSTGAGDNLSFGLTKVFRGRKSDALIDKCGGLYNAGEWVGTGVGLAFGAAHLGRNALYQAGGRGGLRQGLQRLAYDNKAWTTVTGRWTDAFGRSRLAGPQLHHWLIPQSYWGRYVPQGIRNAGFNYFPLSTTGHALVHSSWLTEWVSTGVVAGIYGSLINGSGCQAP
jgi:hypothetical protein